MPVASDVTLFVSSADNYEDCWFPFFRLLERYWPDCPYPIALNTEEKEFSYPGLAITSLKIGRAPDGARWDFTSATIEGLKKVRSKYILWTLEDLFLTGKVDTARIEKLVTILRSRDYTQIHLTPTARSRSAYLPSEHPELWTIGSNYRYRLSLLNGLWERERFMSYLVPGENPWQVEIFGSRRAGRRNDTFFCVRSETPKDPNSWPMPYMVTGVTKGKWEHKVEPLFAENGIYMDFSRRGFFEDPGPIWRRLQLAKQVFFSSKWKRR